MALLPQPLGPQLMALHRLAARVPPQATLSPAMRQVRMLGASPPPYDRPVDPGFPGVLHGDPNAGGAQRAGDVPAPLTPEPGVQIPHFESRSSMLAHAADNVLGDLDPQSLAHFLAEASALPGPHPPRLRPGANTRAGLASGLARRAAGY